jgi:hypothetical protein
LFDFVLDQGTTLPFVDITEVLQINRKNTLAESLNTPLELKIPTTKLLLVQSYPDIFELGDSGISDALSFYLSDTCFLVMVVLNPRQ